MDTATMTPQQLAHYVRTRVAVVVKQRRKIMRLGRSRRLAATPQQLELAMGRIEQWLERNPCPSAGTLRCFLHTHASDLVVVAPGKRGYDLINEILDLINDNNTTTP